VDQARDRQPQETSLASPAPEGSRLKPFSVPHASAFTIEAAAETLATEMGLSPARVLDALRLLEQGATIPFIARYRKEQTGAMDEVRLAAIRDRHGELEALERRRSAILQSLAERDLLTAEFDAKIRDARTAGELEDLYLPYRPKRRTRATMAREKGLEPLAKWLLESDDLRPSREAERFVRPGGVPGTVQEALAGACDIVAEWISEDVRLRGSLRRLFAGRALLRSARSPARATRGKTDTAREDRVQVYRDYFQWEESAKRAPSHRVLALLRGEREGHLVVHALPPEEEALDPVRRAYARGRDERRDLLEATCTDAYRRLLAPSLENELKGELKQRADRAAAEVFAANLRELLLAPPLGQRPIMAVDPGFRTGCKVVCLDAQGTLLHHETLYPLEPRRETARAAERIRAMVAAHKSEVIAVGNGTGGREAMSFLRGMDDLRGLPVVMVNEAGASVYSASEAAREEFADKDVTVRGAVSIGRRLADPLSELVKIEPQAIGVGQYQHDVDQKLLQQKLADTVTSCVNLVGVELNTASSHLLRFVSGLGGAAARAIVRHRSAHGPFRGRSQLLAVSGIGERTYQQAAGFLRIRGAENPLDSSAVHPERYPLVERMAADLGVSVNDLVGNRELVGRIKLDRYAGTQVGPETLEDIRRELLQPGRDPRPPYQEFAYSETVHGIEDLEVGMKLPGVVTNVTAFGAFVDIGVHRDGLIHISRLAGRYVRDPAEVVRVGQTVTATVVEVDRERGRIGLSLID
jgi:uncharacterized protein